MAFLKNTKAPAGAPGHSWDDPDHVVEVEDPALVGELLAIPGGGFVEVQEDGTPLPGGVVTEEPAEEAEAETAAETDASVAEEPTEQEPEDAPKRGRRAKAEPEA